MAAVDGDLLEGLNEFARALKVCYQLVGRIPTGLKEVLEPRPTQWAQTDLLGEIVASAGKAGGNRKADADRIVDLMRDAGDKTTERGELLGGDKILLRLARILKRFLGALFGGAQLVLGLAPGNGVLAKYGDRARHLANLVARLRSLDGRIVSLVHHRMHCLHDRT